MGIATEKGWAAVAEGMEQARSEALRRLRRVEGQIRGLQRMVEEGKDCEAILTQLMAARAALDKAGLFIVERHLAECLRGTADEQVKNQLYRIVELFLRFGVSGESGERSSGDGYGTGGSD